MVKNNSYDDSQKERYIELISSFFQAPSLTVRSRFEYELLNPGSAVAKAWRDADPKTEAEIKAFYQETDSYVYDLAADHCRMHRRFVWSVIRNRLSCRPSVKRILVYGDGIGTDTRDLAQAGYSVTYYDLPGLTSRFARYRLDREGLLDSVVFLDAVREIPMNSFDVLISIEVLEHLPDPVKTMADFAQYLMVGGIALITESFGSIGSQFPSHIVSNYQYAGKTHRMMEDLGFASTYYNRDPVNYPMEFTKVGRNIVGTITRLKCKCWRALECRWRRFRNSNSPSRANAVFTLREIASTKNHSHG